MLPSCYTSLGYNQGTSRWKYWCYLLLFVNQVNRWSKKFKEPITPKGCLRFLIHYKKQKDLESNWLKIWCPPAFLYQFIMDSSSSYSKNGTTGPNPPIEGDMEEKMKDIPTEVVDMLSVTIQCQPNTKVMKEERHLQN